MKYLKKFNPILESFTSDDLNDLLHDIRDYGLKVTIKEGWIQKDKISTTNTKFHYMNAMPYLKSLKTYFINIFGSIEHEDLSNLFSDMQELKDRSEDIGVVDLIYEIESFERDKGKIVFRGDFRLITNQENDEGFLDTYKNILTSHGYRLGEHPDASFREICFVVDLPDPNIPKLSNRISEMDKEEREKRAKLIKSLKYENWDKVRKEIREILDPIATKNNMTIRIQQGEAFGKLYVSFSANPSGDLGNGD